MGRTALVADPLSFGVDADRVHLAEDGPALGADAYDRPQASGTEDIFRAVFRMFPGTEIFRLIAKIAYLHSEPLKKVWFIITLMAQG
jgi:hypothetical protein